MTIALSNELRKEMANAIALNKGEGPVQGFDSRTPALEGIATSVFPNSCHTHYSDDLNVQFSKFLTEREKIIERSDVNAGGIDIELHRENAILAVDWESSLFDGSVSPETCGYLDDDCMPAWDTWLALAEIASSHGKRCLICWVPERLSEKVNFGIKVDAAACMSWIRIESDGKFSLMGWGKSIA